MSHSEARLLAESRKEIPDLRTPDELAQEFLSRRAGVALAPSTVQTYDTTLYDYVTFLHDEGTAVLKTTIEDVLQYIEWCVRRGNRRSTVQTKLTVIRELYRFIRLRTEAGAALSLDPIELTDIDIGDYRMPESMEREALSRDEVRKLFDAVDSLRNRLMMCVGVETGFRNSDIRGLQLEDVDYVERTLHAAAPKNSRPYDVPISDELTFELDWWVTHRRDGFTNCEDSEYLFPGRDSEWLSTNSSLNSIVVEAAERAGIQDVIGETQLSEREQETFQTNKQYRQWNRVTVHTLRHTFITLLKDSGVDLPYRQLVANHASPTTTRGYTHGTDDVFEKIREQYTPPR